MHLPSSRHNNNCSTCRTQPPLVGHVVVSANAWPSDALPRDAATLRVLGRADDP
jgi:hypothetical protein